jgi:hypothetical protein
MASSSTPHWSSVGSGFSSCINPNARRTASLSKMSSVPLSIGLGIVPALILARSLDGL